MLQTVMKRPPSSSPGMPRSNTTTATTKSMPANFVTTSSRAAQRITSTPWSTAFVIPPTSAKGSPTQLITTANMVSRVYPRKKAAATAMVPPMIPSPTVSQMAVPVRAAPLSRSRAISRMSSVVMPSPATVPASAAKVPPMKNTPTSFAPRYRGNTAKVAAVINQVLICPTKIETAFCASECRPLVATWGSMSGSGLLPV